jgi:hypothetical protein
VISTQEIKKSWEPTPHKKKESKRIKYRDTRSQSRNDDNFSTQRVSIELSKAERFAPSVIKEAKTEKN